jgi:ABC-type molybdate transport system ATPase subunit
MALIELISYRLPPIGGGNGLTGIDLSLDRGEIAAVNADRPEDARLLLRALATLVPPASGTFRFAGEALDFFDYRRLLPVKRRIGYVAADAALLSNRTLRQNLLAMRYYFENSLAIDLDPETKRLCRQLGIEKELDRLPSHVDPVDLLLAVAVREIGKDPDLMLFDRPEETIGKNGFRRLLDRIGPSQKSQIWVCASKERVFLEAVANRRIRIRGGAMSAE